MYGVPIEIGSGPQLDSFVWVRLMKNHPISDWLSSPARLLAIGIGLLAPWIITFVDPMEGLHTHTEACAGGCAHGDMGPLAARFWLAVDWAVWAVCKVAPHFGRFNPIGRLVEGRVVTWGSVGAAMAVLVFLQGAFAMLVSVFLYVRRELARVIVWS